MLFCRKRVLSRIRFFAVIFLAMTAFLSLAVGIRSAEPLAAKESTDELSRVPAAVLRDWEKQESLAERTFGSPEALVEQIRRGEELLDALADEGGISPENRENLQTALTHAAHQLGQLDSAGDEADRASGYVTLRTAIRTAALANPRIANKPILFVKVNPFVCQMLHEYLSYFYQLSNRAGGGIYRLKNPGVSMEVESLTDEKFPRGVFATPSISWDGESLYFAFADFSSVQNADAPVLTTDEFRHWQNRQGRGVNDFYLQEYLPAEEGKYHLFRMNLADRAFEQITHGSGDDLSPVELPEGDVVFISTRRGGFGRCHNPWEPLPVQTLHRLNANGHVATLSWHETNEWHPSILPDGRVLYTRWDYVDRSAAHYHGLWMTNPDGTGAVSLFGNYTQQVNACYQGMAIPGSKNILFIAGAHHLNVGGALVVLDPTQVRYDTVTGEDSLDALENLSPEIPFPETPDECPSHYYYSPFPLSDDYFFVSYSNEPLGGMLSHEVPQTTGKLGIYYRDRFGNLELLYEDETMSCQYPIQVAAREKPFTISSQRVDSTAEENPNPEGTLFLSNVYESLKLFPPNRPVTALRVFQILPKYPDHRANHPRISHAHAENARIYLGSVPVEPDGSAFFRVPAEKPLYFQAVDTSGRAIQTMRSEVYLQPGENRGCVGCHEQAQTTFNNDPGQSSALGRAPSVLTPGPDGTAPFSYPRLIQPILDAKCVSCHDGASPSAPPNLTGGASPPFSESYQNLKPFLRWHEWGGATIRPIVSFPGECGADMSPLSKILDDATHATVDLTDAERRAFYLWMDATIPFYGTFDDEGQADQRNGEVIPIPACQ